jgi:hypothetical protein
MNRVLKASRILTRLGIFGEPKSIRKSARPNNKNWGFPMESKETKNESLASPHELYYDSIDKKKPYLQNRAFSRLKRTSAIFSGLVNAQDGKNNWSPEKTFKAARILTRLGQGPADIATRNWAKRRKVAENSSFQNLLSRIDEKLKSSSDIAIEKGEDHPRVDSRFNREYAIVRKQAELKTKDYVSADDSKKIRKADRILARMHGSSNERESAAKRVHESLSNIVELRSPEHLRDLARASREVGLPKDSFKYTQMAMNRYRRINKILDIARKAAAQHHAAKSILSKVKD